MIKKAKLLIYGFATIRLLISLIPNLLSFWQFSYNHELRSQFTNKGFEGLSITYVTYHMTTPTCFAVTEEITFFDNHENLIFD